MRGFYIIFDKDLIKAESLLTTNTQILKIDTPQFHTLILTIWFDLTIARDAVFRYLLFPTSLDTHQAPAPLIAHKDQLFYHSDPLSLLASNH